MPRKRDNLLHRLIENFSPGETLLHPATLFLIASVATIAAANHVWHRYQNHLIDPEAFVLTNEKIQVAPPPAWTGADARALILGETSPQPSLLDTELVSKTAATFQSVGFVEQINQIEKTRSGLKVDLVYRDAVGMVELNGKTVPNWKRSPIVLPVDRQGVILPGKIVADTELIRFSIFDPHRDNGLPTWSPWPDERVQEAAAIASVLAPNWKSFGVYRIVTFRKPDEESDRTPFEIWPDVGTQVVWGNPPGHEAENEVSADQKIALLQQFAGQIREIESTGPTADRHSFR